jgi:hypothetical protein
MHPTSVKIYWMEQFIGSRFFIDYVDQNSGKEITKRFMFLSGAIQYAHERLLVLLKGRELKSDERPYYLLIDKEQQKELALILNSAKHAAINSFADKLANHLIPMIPDEEAECRRNIASLIKLSELFSKDL